MLQVILLLVSAFGYYLLMFILFHGRKTALYPTFFVSSIMLLGMLAGFVNAFGCATVSLSHKDSCIIVISQDCAGNIKTEK